MFKIQGDQLVIFKGETSKAYERRTAEGWFQKYAPEDRCGLDLGAGQDPLNQTFRRWDQIYGDGDAANLDGVPSESFWTVHASHLLEHLRNPRKALRRWYDVLRPGGHLIVLVPHRDLYEKKSMLPSQWNGDHKSFWLPDEEDPPCTKSLKHEILSAIPNAEIVSLRVLQDDYLAEMGKGMEPYRTHPAGEYSIEAIVRKPGLSA